MEPARAKKKRTEKSGSTYFLGIGIDDYQHWPPLYNAVSDVKAIAHLLKEDYGLLEKNKTLLLNKNATESNIISSFEEMIDKVRKEDSLLIYYAGHGHLNNRERGFWIPVDSPKDKVYRYIRNSTIRDYIGDIKSLHSGGGGRSKVEHPIFFNISFALICLSCFVVTFQSRRRRSTQSWTKILGTLVSMIFKTVPDLR